MLFNNRLVVTASAVQILRSYKWETDITIKRQR